VRWDALTAVTVKIHKCWSLKEQSEYPEAGELKAVALQLQLPQEIPCEKQVYEIVVTDS
jgi:hypothetical protein